MDASRSKSLVLVVFIDALGWKIFEEDGFMQGHWKTSVPVESVFGYSSACDPTILTGLMPAEHKHFSCFFYSPHTSPFRNFSWLRFLPRALADRGRVRSKISQVCARLLGFSGYFQLYNVPFSYLPLLDYNEKKDIFKPGGIVGGQATFFDALRQANIPFSVSDWRGSEEENIAKLRDDIQSRRVNFAYLFLGKLDALLHQFGKKTDAHREHLRWYEKQIESVLRIANDAYDSVRYHVISDHGMADITETLDIMTDIENLDLEYGKDYIALFDSTMARFWFFNDDSRTRIEALLQNYPQGKLLSDEKLVEWGVFFDDYRYGEAIFLVKPGVLLCPSHMGSKPIAGMHGYDPEHEDSKAVYLSSEVIANTPKRLDDLYGVISAEINKLGAVDE